MKRSKVVTIVILLALLVVGCTRRAEQWRHGSAVKHIAQALGLDEDQEARLKEVENRILWESRALCLSKSLIEEVVKKQIRSEAFNTDEVKKVVTTEMAKSNVIMGRIIDHFAEFHGTLSSAQKVVLSEHIDKWSKGRHRGRHGDWCKGVTG